MIVDWQRSVRGTELENSHLADDWRGADHAAVLEVFGGFAGVGGDDAVQLTLGSSQVIANDLAEDRPVVDDTSEVADVGIRGVERTVLNSCSGIPLVDAVQWGWTTAIDAAVDAAAG